MPVCNASGDVGKRRAMMPIGQSKDARTTTPAQRWRNASNNACVILAMTQAQERNASKNTCAALAGSLKADHHAMTLGRAMKPLSMTTNTASSSHTLMCCGYVMSGKTPVCVAGGNARVARVTTLAQQWQRHPWDKGNNAGAMLVTVTVQHWQ